MGYNPNAIPDGGGKGLWTADERIAGFLETMEAAGLEVEPAFCVQAGYQSDRAERATVPMLTRPDRPTAIIGGNNVIALGALQAILDLGFRCPDDVSVAGIDDVPWSGLVRPRDTTAAQPIEDITGPAMEWLLGRIADRGDPPPARTRVFQPHLIAGNSCRDVRVRQPEPDVATALS